MKVKLGNIAVLINGDRGKNYPSQADIVSNGDVPFVNAGHLNGRDISFDEMNYISQEKFNQLNSGKFIEGDILYCLRGSLGKKGVVRNNINGAIASSLVIIRPDTEKVNVDYLMFALDSPSIMEQLVKANNGSSQPNLSAASVREYCIDLPESSIQEEIVAKLSKVRKIIDARQQELQALDDLIKARFVEMFGNEKYPQTNISELVSGKVPSVKKDFSPEDTIKYIDISSIDNKQNVMTGYTEYVVKDAPSRAQQHIKRGDIVISTVRPNLRNVAITPYYDSNLVASSGFCVLRAEKCLPEYLMAIVTSDKFTDDMTKVVTGANYPAIKDSDVMNYQVALPPMELQKQFAEFCKQIDKSKVVVQKALDEAQLLFDSLMQQYFG